MVNLEEDMKKYREYVKKRYHEYGKKYHKEYYKNEKNRENRRKYYREYYKKKKELGLCLFCKEKATRGTLCRKHFKMHKLNVKKYVEKKASKGLCRVCKNPISPTSKIFCEEHLKKFRKHKER